MDSPALTMRPQTTKCLEFSKVVTSVDPLLGKTYKSLGLSKSQDDGEVCSRSMEITDGSLKHFPAFYACIYKPLSLRFIVHSLSPTDNYIKDIIVSSKL